MTAEPKTVAEAAEATGLSAHTLRYYDRVGLLKTQRNPAGQRRYGPEELLALAFISRLRATGMPIRRIKAYADAVRAGRGRVEGLPLLLEHRNRLVEDLAERRSHLDAVDRKIAAYRASLSPPDATTRGAHDPQGDA